ncbi:MAG: rod shape-determining protein MreC [Magnetococcales bacterium]|nr:rod shape-determining protein MreC [Magnetococcales bacterium]
MTAVIVLKQQSRQTVLASLALLAALLLLTLSPTAGSNSFLGNGRDLLQELALDGIGPLLRLFQTPIAASHSVYERIQGWQRIEQENHKLKLELDRLRSLGVQAEELSLENQRLRLLLGMRPHASVQEVVARIIGNSSSAFARSFLVDAGQEEGVAPDATALGITAQSGGGLLGRVIQTSQHTALILTLPDFNSRVPVLIQRSRVRAIVSGRNKPLLEMEFVPKGSDIRVGDLVVTSGVGGVFPKGIPVGRIQAIAATEETGLFHLISVQPVIDFDRVEEVRLLLQTEPDEVPNEVAEDQATPPKIPAPKTSSQKIPTAEERRRRDTSGQHGANGHRTADIQVTQR